MTSTAVLDGECDPTVIECDVAPPPVTYPTTHGVYIDHFNPQDDDGWFGGDDEIRFDLHFALSRQGYDWGEDVTIRRNQPPFVGSNELILVADRPCLITAPPAFVLAVTEEDPNWDDNWGTFGFPPFEYGLINQLWWNGDRKMYIRFVCR
jgi:hypothetical protein